MQQYNQVFFNGAKYQLSKPRKLLASVRSWRQLRVPEWDTTQQVSDLPQSMQLDESVRCWMPSPGKCVIHRCE